MPVSSGIYGALNQEAVKPLSPLEAQANAYQLQGAKQAFNDDQTSRQALISSGGDQNRLLQLYVQGGLGKQADALRKSMLETEKAKSDIAGTDAKTKHTLSETDALKIGQHADMLSQVQTPEQALQWAKMGLDGGTLKPEQYQMAINNITNLRDQSSFEAWKQQAALGARKYIELNKPTFQNQNLGGTMQTLALPGLGGKPQVVNSSAVTQSPDSIAGNETRIKAANISAGASMANAAAQRDMAQATRDAANIQTGFSNEQGLRKEFEGLPEVKTYKQAYPTYAAIKDAVGRNTTQSDINLVYGIAKLYDPNSVVREGEYATVANSPNIPERIKGYAQYLSGGGRLSPEIKKQIMDEATGRIGTFQAEAGKARKSYEGIAKQRGMNPASVFADMGDFVGGATPAAPAPGKTDIHSQAEAILKRGK